MRAACPAVSFVIVYCVLLLVVPARLVVGPLGAAGTPANIAGLGALVWWLLATLRGQTGRSRWTPIHLAAGLLTLAILASYANGMARGWWAPPSVRESTAQIWTLVPIQPGQVATTMKSSADRQLLTMGGRLGILLLAVDGLRDRVDLERLVRWAVWLGTFVASLGIIQFFTGLDIAGFFRIPGLRANAAFGEVDARSMFNRPASTATHPIEFGVVLAALLPLALHYAMHRPGRKSAKIPAVVIPLAAAMSVSRSAIVVAAVALLVLLLGWSPQRRRRALIILPFAIAGTRLLVPGLVGTIYSLFAHVSDDPSVAGRTGDYAAADWIISMHPWLGRGLGTFVPAYYRVLDDQALVFVIELGFVGAACALLFHVISFASARRAFRFGRDPRERNLGLSLSASIAGLAISSFTFDSWGFAMVGGITFLVVGMAGAMWRLNTDSALEHAVAAPRVAVA